MGWFADARRKRYREAIVRVAPCWRHEGPPEMSLRHLKRIATVARRTSHGDHAAPWAFQALLPLMVHDLRITEELARADDAGLSAVMDTRLAELGRSIFDAIAPELGSLTPAGCQVNRETVVAAALDLMRKRRPADKVRTDLVALVTDEPGRFIDGYMAWAHARAEGMFNALESALRLQAPPKCSVDPASCRNELVDLLKTHRSTEDISKAFVARIRESPGIAYRGYEDACRNHEAQARGIWKHVKAQLSGNRVPYGVALNEEGIASAISRMLVTGSPASAVEQNIRTIIAAKLDSLSEIRSAMPFAASKSSSAGTCL